MRKGLKKPYTTSSYRVGARGASLAEFAIIAGVIFTVLIAIVELAYYVYVRNSVSAALSYAVKRAQMEPNSLVELSEIEGPSDPRYQAHVAARLAISSEATTYLHKVGLNKVKFHSATFDDGNVGSARATTVSQTYPSQSVEFPFLLPGTSVEWKVPDGIPRSSTNLFICPEDWLSEGSGLVAGPGEHACPADAHVRDRKISYRAYAAVYPFTIAALYTQPVFFIPDFISSVTVGGYGPGGEGPMAPAIGTAGPQSTRLFHPTDTPVPTSTPTASSTSMPILTDTPTSAATDTPTNAGSETPTPTPTTTPGDTSTKVPTITPVSPPTSTRTPAIECRDCKGETKPDVDGDCVATQADARSIVDYLNTRGPGPVGSDPIARSLDVNYDGSITSADLRRIIDYINNDPCLPPGDCKDCEGKLIPDTDGDCRAAGEDAQQILEYLRINGAGPIGSDAAAKTMDVNRDGEVTAADFRYVVDYMNNSPCVDTPTPAPTATPTNTPGNPSTNTPTATATPATQSCEGIPVRSGLDPLCPVPVDCRGQPIYPPVSYDVNNDGWLNKEDRAALIDFYFSNPAVLTRGDPRYDAAFDTNGDGTNEFMDLMRFNYLSTDPAKFLDAPRDLGCGCGQNDDYIYHVKIEAAKDRKDFNPKANMSEKLREAIKGEYVHADIPELGELACMKVIMSQCGWDTSRATYMSERCYWQAPFNKWANKPRCDMDECVRDKMRAIFGGGNEGYLNRQCQPVTNSSGTRACGEVSVGWDDGIVIGCPISLLWDESSSLENARTITKFNLHPGFPGRLFEWRGSSHTPLLVYDPGHTGKISGPEQLFGNWTFGGKTRAALLEPALNDTNEKAAGWRDGFEALAQLDSDADGELDGEELEHIGIWFDHNQDAISQPGEVLPIRTAGVTKLFTKFNHIDPQTKDIFASRGFERIENGRIVRGGSVDWFGTAYDNIFDAARREFGSRASGAHAQTIDVQHAPKRADRQIDDRDKGRPHKSLAPGQNVHGVWVWSLGESAARKTIFPHAGILTFNDSPAGFSGHSINEVPLKANSRKAEKYMRMLELTGSRTIDATGRVSITFELFDTPGFRTVSTARLSENGLTLEGASQLYPVNTRTAGNEQRSVLEYKWTAKRWTAPVTVVEE